MFAEEMSETAGCSRRSQEIAAAIPDEGIIAVLEGMIRRPSPTDGCRGGKKPHALDTRTKKTGIFHARQSFQRSGSGRVEGEILKTRVNWDL